MRTKEQAEKAGQLMMDQLPKGWELVIHENLGWYCYAQRGCSTIRPSHNSTPDSQEYWCMIAGSPDHPVTGGPWTADINGYSKTPMEAFRKTKAAMKQYIDVHNTIYREIDAFDKERAKTTLNILQAYGSHGSYAMQWNWCHEDEVVGVHGMVCCNSLTCGCNRSFIGINSAKSTTQAVVKQIAADKFDRLREILRNTVAMSWGNSESIAQAAVAEFDTLCDRIRHFNVGEVVTITKNDDGWELHRG